MRQATTAVVPMPPSPDASKFPRFRRFPAARHPPPSPCLGLGRAAAARRRGAGLVAAWLALGPAAAARASPRLRLGHVAARIEAVRPGRDPLRYRRAGG